MMRMALVLMLVMGFVGCGYIRDVGRSVEDYVRGEVGWSGVSGGGGGGYKFDGRDVSSWVWGDEVVAIPCVEGRWYYRSPYAPGAGMMEARCEAWSRVRCPWTGKVLVIPDRGEVGEYKLEELRGSLGA